ncbi:MAG: DinB family protein, partial [Tuberibacillus sp.]
GISASVAAWQPPGGGNTIWQTVNHINFYNSLMIKRFKGIQAPMTVSTNTDTFGAPGDPNDQEGWEKTLEEAKTIAEDMKKVFEDLTEKDLETNDLGEKIASWIMHDSYHTGQIVLLRKMQASWPATRED